MNRNITDVLGDLNAGAEANRRAKAEELVESAKKALHMPIYTGSYASH